MISEEAFFWMESYGVSLLCRWRLSQPRSFAHCYHYRHLHLLSILSENTNLLSEFTSLPLSSLPSLVELYNLIHSFPQPNGLEAVKVSKKRVPQCYWQHWLGRSLGLHFDRIRPGVAEIVSLRKEDDGCCSINTDGPICRSLSQNLLCGTVPHNLSQIANFTGSCNL